VRGFGVVLYTILWLKQDPNVYAFPIQHVYPDSPAAKAGLKRGDVIYEVNGTPLGDSNYSNAWYALNYGSSSSLSLGYKNVINDKAPITTVSLPLGSYYENPIACSKVLDVPAEMNPSGKKIGYLSYLAFDNAYDSDLVSSFTSFASQGVEEFILDLRFNNGGVVDSSTLLASMMLGEDKVGGVYAYLRRHKNNPYGDSTCTIIKNNPSTNQDLPNLGI
jgi:C-terminal processing protease CtpA/Prc